MAVAGSLSAHRQIRSSGASTTSRNDGSSRFRLLAKAPAHTAQRYPGGGWLDDGVIDLRSDTLTRPTEAMRAAMAGAEVGDDVYGEDPTVAALEDRVAGMFGHEAALFTPTGSMANVLAVASVVAPGEEVLCESSAHIARAELGAHGAITGITMRTWTDPRGQVDLAAVESMYAPDMGPFFVRTAAVSVE